MSNGARNSDGRDSGLRLAAALVETLDDDALDALADRLAPRLAGRLERAGDLGEDGWLDAKAAAAYLGLSVHALHRLTAERRIPLHQDAPGAKLWFRRSELTGGVRRAGGVAGDPGGASTSLPWCCFAAL